MKVLQQIKQQATKCRDSSAASSRNPFFVSWLIVRSPALPGFKSMLTMHWEKQFSFLKGSLTNTCIEYWRYISFIKEGGVSVLQYWTWRVFVTFICLNFFSLSLTISQNPSISFGKTNNKLISRQPFLTLFGEPDFLVLSPTAKGIMFSRTDTAP